MDLPDAVFDIETSHLTQRYRDERGRWRENSKRTHKNSVYGFIIIWVITLFTQFCVALGLVLYNIESLNNITDIPKGSDRYSLVASMLFMSILVGGELASDQIEVPPNCFQYFNITKKSIHSRRPLSPPFLAVDYQP